MFKKILGGIAAALLVLVGVIATRPAEYTVQRSATLPVQPGVAFTVVNDFHRWAEWSPWEKLDPAMKRTFEGAYSGTGAVYGWVGNKDVGEGRMTIEESKPSDFVRVKLEFIKPFPATSVTTFTFKPAGEGTEVVWNMVGHNDFVGKAFCLFMDMDKMVGGDFERGLASMKTAAEAEAKRRAEADAAARVAAEQAAKEAAAAEIEAARAETDVVVETAPAAGQPAVAAPTP